MRHSYSFRVWGDTFAEVEKRARDAANDYFGSPDYTLDVDAEALQSNAGDVLTVEGRCEARLGGAA